MTILNLARYSAVLLVFMVWLTLSLLGMVQ